MVALLRPSSFLLIFCACGAADYAQRVAAPPVGRAAFARSEPNYRPGVVSSPDRGPDVSFESDDSGGELTPAEAPAEEPAARRAQAQAQTTTAPLEPETANDAFAGQLLIYEATLHMAVYRVEENQRTVIRISEELGGFLSRQDDQTVVARIPAGKFREALSRIEALGDLLHRNIQATDVSEEFRDIEIRLRNAEQVRDRLAALLQQARNVTESLQIERELERLTAEIEVFKGRLRFLQDRIAFSTITVTFRPREQESLQGELFHLPFIWLQRLGLQTLLELR